MLGFPVNQEKRHQRQHPEDSIQAVLWQVTSDNLALSEVRASEGKNIGLSIYLLFNLITAVNLLYLNKKLPLTDDAGGQCTDDGRAADGSSSRTASEEGR
jgi:hypothetical protein